MDRGVMSDYNSRFRFKLLLIGLGMILLATTAILSICVGSAGLTLTEVFSALTASVSSGMDADLTTKNNIIWQLRMPRIFMAIIAGAGLSLCGAVMQGITRNPLVSPYTVGISSAAAFGASLAIMFGSFHGIARDDLTVICAFISALICALLVYLVSSSRGMNPVTLVLLGTALTYLFSAFTSTLQYMANEHQLESIIRWTFGSLTGADWRRDRVMLSILVFCFMVFMRYAWALNAISSGGDEVSKGLGINVSSVRAITGLSAVALTAGIISFTGVIGFVGIVAPHMARMIVGGDHRFLLPFSAVLGALLLLVADTLGRTLFAPIIIPVGIIVAYVGVPIFIHLIIKSKKEYF